MNFSRPGQLQELDSQTEFELTDAENETLEELKNEGLLG